MKRAGLNFLCCIMLSLTFSACEGRRAKLKLVEGNFYFSRGLVNEAIGAYLEAANEPLVSPYANFALGTTYLNLEQPAAALERFNAAESAVVEGRESRNLLYRIRYNSGIAYFQKEEFAPAAEAFRRALEADNTAMDAKRNLELCIIALQMKNKATEIMTNESGTIGGGQNERNDMIFDYIRRRESDNWKSWEWSGEDDSGGKDY